MENDNVPLSQMAIEFGAFGKAFVSLLKEIKKSGLSTEDALNASMSLANSYLNHANAKKFAENMSEMTFTPAEE